jgi:hypothetical protein
MSSHPTLDDFNSSTSAPVLLGSAEAARINEMANHVQQLIAEVQRINAKNVSLEQQLAEQAAVVSAHIPASSSSTSRLAAPAQTVRLDVKPPLFNGHTALHLWMSAMERYFKAAGTADHRKVAQAAACLDLQLGPWWDQVNPNDAITTWDQMKVLLIKQFQPVAQAELARTRLDNLSQRGSVADYCNAFRSAVLPIVGMSVEEQLHAFQRGLNMHIRAKLEDRAKPANLDEAMNSAVLIEERRKNLMRSMPRVPYQSFSSYRSAAPQYSSAAAAAASATPMDLSLLQEQDDCDYSQLWSDPAALTAPAAALNAITPFASNRFHHRTPLVKLSDEDRQKLMSENRCFRCRQQGHRAMECGKRPNTKGNQQTTPAKPPKNE